MPPIEKLNGSDIDSKWSMLAPDLIRSVLERLNFLDFHRARYISSNWYSTSKSCIKQNPTPWLILFSNDSHVSCKLYDLHYKKTYMVKDLGLDFHRSRCLASSGSWFLMLDHRTDFYLLNLFTRERIHLPTSGKKSTKAVIKKAVLWVDERSRDYLVVWNLDSFFVYYKKRDGINSWRVFQPLNYQGCIDMVLRETKLYVLNQREIVSVFYFSCGGDDSPKECESFAYPDHTLFRPSRFSQLVIALPGEVLAIARGLGVCLFNVYNMDPNSSKWRKINSIGDEALFLDLGTTVAAKDGFKNNWIYFCNDNNNGTTSNSVFHIGRGLTYQPFQHLLASSSIPPKDARWFFSQLLVANGYVKIYYMYSYFY